MPAEAVANIVLSGLLTGLVYGLMALGLSVIYGVVRIVNFAHGELMAVAMYGAVFAFALAGIDPLWMLVPTALAFFGLGYVLQRGLVNPFIDRPEHAQFILLLALALVIVNALLVAFGPDARAVQVGYALDSYQLGPLLVDKVRVICAVVALAACALLFAIFRYTAFGKAIRACADNLLGAQVIGLNVKHLYALTFGLGVACCGVAGCLMSLLVDVTPSIGPAYTLRFIPMREDLAGPPKPGTMLPHRMAVEQASAAAEFAFTLHERMRSVAVVQSGPGVGSPQYHHAPALPGLAARNDRRASGIASTIRGSNNVVPEQ